MQRQLQITLRDLHHSDAIDAHIREKVEKLELFYPHITGCHVVVEMPHKHKHRGKHFSVSIDLKVPGNQIVINRDNHEDVYVVLRDAFDAAKRQLEDYGRRQRGDVKSHELPVRGRVVRMVPEEGYGFIATLDGRELHFHRENLVNADFDRLEVGAEVQFLEEVGAEGPHAKRVSTGKHHPGG